MARRKKPPVITQSYAEHGVVEGRTTSTRLHSRRRNDEQKQGAVGMLKGRSGYDKTGRKVEHEHPTDKVGHSVDKYGHVKIVPRKK